MGNRVCQELVAATFGTKIKSIIIILRLGWGTVSINPHAANWIQRHLNNVFKFANII